MSDYLAVAWPALKYMLLTAVGAFALVQLGFVLWLIWSMVRARRDDIAPPPR